MILVLGASGNVGYAVANHLSDKPDTKIRAFVNSKESQAKLNKPGVTDTYVGDLRNDSDVQEAMEGCNAVFHIAPPFMEDEIEIGNRVVKKAKQTGVKHIVYNSVLHPQLTHLDHHAKKLAVEEIIIESGLTYNILQPAMYMQNLKALWPNISNNGVLTAFSAADKKLSLIDTFDLGEVAANIFTNSSLHNATFELAGPDVLTYYDIANLIGNVIDEEVHVKKLNDLERKKLASSMGWSDYATKAFLKMANHYDEHGFVGGCPKVPEAILDRTPNTYQDFLNRFLG